MCESLFKQSDTGNHCPLIILIQECSLTPLEAMERLSLNKRIEAELLKNNFTFINYHIDVPEKGQA